MKYLILEVDSDRQCVTQSTGELPKQGERLSGLFDVADLHEVVAYDPQAFDHEGELMTGGRISVRKIISG